jgi:putative FmdB family regulatory protein
MKTAVESPDTAFGEAVTATADTLSPRRSALFGQMATGRQRPSARFQEHNGSIMPIYEYACDSCGNKFEKLVRSTEAEAAAAAACPSCGKQELHQEYSTFAARSAGADCGPSEMSQCPAGMCGNPGMCGRN